MEAEEFRRLISLKEWRPFEITLTSGTRLTVRHEEEIAHVNRWVVVFENGGVPTFFELANVVSVGYLDGQS